MSVNKLIFRELNEIYKSINNAAPIIQDEKNNLFLHNKQRFNKYGITSQKTFVGESSYGVCSFLLKYIIKYFISNIYQDKNLYLYNYLKNIL